MRKTTERLPDSELEVMQVLWHGRPPLSRAEVEQALAEAGRPLAPTTVLTFLSRLVNRGYLAVEKRGKANLYTPLVEEKDYLALESGQMLRRVFGGSLTALATSLVDAGVSREDIEELRAMLEEGRL